MGGGPNPKSAPRFASKRCLGFREAREFGERVAAAVAMLVPELVDLLLDFLVVRSVVCAVLPTGAATEWFCHSEQLHIAGVFDSPWSEPAALPSTRRHPLAFKETATLVHVDSRSRTALVQVEPLSRPTACRLVAIPLYLSACCASSTTELKLNGVPQEPIRHPVCAFCTSHASANSADQCSVLFTSLGAERGFRPSVASWSSGEPVDLQSLPVPPKGWLQKHDFERTDPPVLASPSGRFHIHHTSQLNKETGVSGLYDRETGSFALTSASPIYDCFENGAYIKYAGAFVDEDVMVFLDRKTRHLYALIMHSNGETSVSAVLEEPCNRLYADPRSEIVWVVSGLSYSYAYQSTVITVRRFALRRSDEPEEFPWVSELAPANVEWPCELLLHADAIPLDEHRILLRTASGGQIVLDADSDERFTPEDAPGPSRDLQWS